MPGNLSVDAHCTFCLNQQLKSEYHLKEKKGWKQISTELGFNPDCCPACKQQTMITILCFDRRGPPDNVTIQSFRNKILPKAIQITGQA